MLSLILPDENADARTTRRIIDEPILVPSIFPVELANALYQAERRGRIPADLTPVLLRDVADLGFTVGPPSFEFSEELDLARSHNLSIYDACYLALAKRTIDPVLITCDDRLRRAATALALPFAPR